MLKSKDAEMEMTLYANDSKKSVFVNSQNNLIIKNPAPDASPSREPNISYREFTVVRA